MRFISFWGCFFMVLSDSAIRKLVCDKQLLQPFEEAKLQGVSYDISTGNVVRVYQRLNQPIDLSDRQQMGRVTQEISISTSKKYHIKPGEYVLVKTKERFQIPSNLTAHVRPRTTLTRMGLLLSDQHMNPNFRGYLFLGLLNATPNVIDIYPGIPMGQMVFEEIDGTVSKEKLYDQKKDAHYQDEDAFVVPTLVQLSKVEREKVGEIANRLMGR